MTLRRTVRDIFHQVALKPWKNLNTVLLPRFVELDRPRHVPVVRQRHCWLLPDLRLCHHRTHVLDGIRRREVTVGV